MTGKRIARFAALAVVPAVVIAVGPGAVAGPGNSWRITAVFGSAAKGELPGGQMVATGATDAFSYWQCTQCSVGTRDRNFIAHWNGRRWWRMALPAPMNYPRSLIAFNANSASNLWALTDSGRAAVWNGSSWAFRSVPAWVLRRDRAGDLVASMSVVGRGDVWVFSEPPPNRPTLAAHYYGGTWHPVILPAVTFGAVVVSRSDIWAMAMTKKSWGTAKPVWVAMHWDGSAWHVLALPRVSVPAHGFVFYAMTATGPRDIWIGRTVCCGHAAGVRLLHWTGRWRVIAGPSGAVELSETEPDGAGGVWIAGIRGGTQQAFQVFFHYGKGRWTRHAVPTRRGYTNVVAGLTWIPRTRSLWAAGFLERGGAEIGDIMKFGP